MQPQVETSTGRLRGSRADGVDSFKGVPFAAPPVGERRFRPPAAVTPWTGERPAVQHARAPAQLPAPFALTGPDIYAGLGETGEDCLYLDVWTPATDGGRRPVMLWIPGGAFVRGAGSQTVYDGTVLARDHDVVVVSMSYRLGVFGFLATGEPGTSNLGLRDQVAALRWVAENARAFGGDPDNVTMFGESAGAVTIACLMSAPQAQGLFHRAIAQSGAGRRLAGADTAAEWSESVLRAVDVSTFDELRRVDVDVLLAAQAQVGAEMFAQHGLSGGYQPWVDADLLHEQPVTAAVAGRTADVPLLTGWNRNEIGLWRAIFPDLHHLRWEDLETRVATQWGPLGAALVALRRAERPEATPAQVWESLATDVEFALPTRAFALAHSRVAPTYLYRFDWGGSTHPDGACHFMEVPFVFGTLDAAGMRDCVGRTATTEALSRIVRNAWTSFARAGSPDLGDRRWTPLGEDETAMVVLDAGTARDTPCPGPPR